MGKGGWGKGWGQPDMMQVMHMMMNGGMGGGWGKGGWSRDTSNMSMITGVAKKNPEKLAWIGGLDKKSYDKNLNKKLKEHMEGLGVTGCKFVNITKGAGGAIFATEQEAQTAIATINGSSFMGKTLEADVWTSKKKTK
mmetsp:Transcript_46220/g.81309  ORF Transcript_46220/g.81309 Transcript_46220/m.81309 type:complete len:138 (-) Transcript_46220:250-663(-)